MSLFPWTVSLAIALSLCGCDGGLQGGVATANDDACSPEAVGESAGGERLASVRAAPAVCSELRGQVTVMMSAAGEASLVEADPNDRDEVLAASDAKTKAVLAVFQDACVERSAAELECLSRAGPYASAYAQTMKGIALCIDRGEGGRAACEARTMWTAERERTALGDCAEVLRALLAEVKEAAQD